MIVRCLNDPGLRFIAVSRPRYFRTALETRRSSEPEAVGVAAFRGRERRETASMAGQTKTGDALKTGVYPIALASLLWTMLAGVLVAPAWAQTDPAQYVATNWQTEQGLPQNSVSAIAQDRDGYIWVATAGGLARFDGVRFKVFGADDIPGLRSTILPISPCQRQRRPVDREQ